MAEKCGCGQAQEGGCGGCGMENGYAYWCDTCKRPVPEKRCPNCGLKARRKKE